MKNSLLLKWLGKMMAYHFHESDQEMDWYAWGSLTLSVTIFMLVLLLPFSYFTFTHMKVDFDSKLDMRRSSMIVAAIVFAISGCVIFLLRKPIAQQAHEELEKNSVSNLKKWFFKLGIYIATLAIIEIIITIIILR